jgi:uncharacterized protein (DUF2147 family)
MKIFITILFTSLFGASFAQNSGDDILGVWWNPEMTSRVEVYKENGLYYGKIIWLKADENEDGSAPRKDLNNDDDALRKRRVFGMVVMKELRWDAKQKEWDKGRLYDPRRGEEYSFYVKLKKDGSLSLFAYVMGMPFLNKEMRCTPYNFDY